VTHRPTATELLEAVQQFLQTEILPTLTNARLRYQMLVAVHVLNVVERELSCEEEYLRAEWQMLSEVLGEKAPAPETFCGLREAVHSGNVNLCTRIREGEFDEPARFRAVLQLVRQEVERKAELNRPRARSGS
jgi:hypothetical protein